MKTSFMIRSVISALLFLLASGSLLIQCKRPGKVTDVLNPAFTEKITAFTSGLISSESAIRIILADDNPNAGGINSPAGDNLFRFKPEVRGHAVWIDKRTVEFRPAEKLKSGQSYHVRFNLGKITDVEKPLSVFEFGFTVVKQDLTVHVEGYQALNENDLVWNRIKGLVNTADNIDYEIIKQYFSARQNEKKLPVSWQTGDDRRSFSFTIDSVRRTEKQGSVVVSWDATREFRDIKGRHETIVPSLSDYKVLDVKVIHQPEQYIEIILSDPIKKKQQFDGLIFLDNGTDLGFSVTGNIIKAYPAAVLRGEAKLTIKEGLVNILGYGLKQEHIADITFEVPKPSIRFTGKGVILPTSKGMVLPFEAVNLNAVDIKIIKIYENNIGHFLQVNRLDGGYELKRAGRLIHRERISLENTPVNLGKWNRFHIDLAKLVEPDQGSIYRVEMSFRKQYSLYPCEEGEEEEDVQEPWQEENEMPDEASYWDSYEDYYEGGYYYDYYDWHQRDNPCSRSFTGYRSVLSRNILASDLGIIAKSGTDGTVFCAVTNLLTTSPVQGVEITLLNYHQQTVGTGKTDNNGFVSIASKEKPFLLIAKSGKQRGYLRMDDGSSLSLGAFDVAGKTVPKGLKAFLYGERGVWRPGDTLFLTSIIEDRQKTLPPGHPVIFELLNPKGQLYSKATKTSGTSGFYTWVVSTAPDAITGNYTLRVKVGGARFDKTIKIESIKPNRLKIDLDFNVKRLSSSKPGLRGTLKVNWLHGAVAANLRSEVTVRLVNAPTEFDKYKGYTFTDPSKRFESEEQTIFDGYLDEKGVANIPADFDVYGNSPGMLNASFTTRAFEKSGDFSIDRFTIPYSPYKSYVGLRTPEGDKRGMLLTDTTHNVEVVVIDENGALLSRGNMEAYIYRLDWRNWWESSESDLADYVGNTYNNPVVTKNFQVVDGKGRFSFRVNHPEWGRFYVRVVDPVSGHSSGKVIYLDWPGWAGRPLRDDPTAASMLMFNSDKEKYKAGEMAEVIIPTGGTGNVLLSIESGSQVLSTRWLTVNSKETMYKFEVTPEMSPNVYIHVTLVQPHASSENDMPVRLYGVIPIFVEDQGTRIDPVIRMPETLEPLQSYSIQVSEKNKKEMTYTLAIVEEGLLNLTRFTTPDPWSDFYAREALGVRTWDLYDLVIGAFGGKLASVLGIGGDRDIIDAAASEKANRFRPVVRFLGPFTVKPGKTNTHKLEMPNYVGSVRAMVVAGHNGAYGTAEKTVQVKKPLMVLATLPRVLGPGESVRLPVTVFAMDQQVKQVSVSVKTNGLLVSGTPSEKTVTFERTGEKIVEFGLKVASQIGIAKVEVVAVSGRNTASHEIELDVRHANPPVTTFTGGAVEPEKTETIPFSLPGIPGTNKATLEVSAIPPVDIDRRLKFLLNYPHGCIEQTTSAVFPQLYLSDIMELDANTRDKIETNVKAGIARLRSFQLAGGGFTYWPGQGYYNSWGTSYAGHFLLEAEKKGYALPVGFKSAWIKSQKQLARQYMPRQQKDIYYQDDLEQAYRLYTLALAGEPEISAMNRLRESTLSIQAKWRLAAAYALSGQTSVAKDLIARETTEIQPYKGLYSSYGSSERDWAMILETLIIIDDKLQAATLARRISAVLSSDQWMSTQSTAYCLMAMSRLASIGGSSAKLRFTYSMNGSKSAEVGSGKSLVQIPLKLGSRSKEGTVSVNNKGAGVIFSRIIMEGIPEAGEENEFSNNLSLHVDYLSRDGEELDVSDLAQGTDFIAKVTVYNPGQFYYRDMALTQVFPPGWEIINTRLWDDKQTIGKDNPTYMDIRDDRIYTYFDLGVGQRKTFIVQLHAAYPGKYYLTGAYCEAMYDNSISALTKGRWIEVMND